MSENLRAVNALPKECAVLVEREICVNVINDFNKGFYVCEFLRKGIVVVGTYRKCVNKVPAQLLSEKSRDPTAFHDLRELSGVTECVWQPEL